MSWQGTRAAAEALEDLGSLEESQADFTPPPTPPSPSEYILALLPFWLLGKSEKRISNASHCDTMLYDIKSIVVASTHHCNRFDLLSAHRKRRRTLLVVYLFTYGEVVDQAKLNQEIVTITAT